MERRPDLDRPELIFPCSDVTIPQQVGFENDLGTGFTVSRTRAIALGMIGLADVLKLSMPVGTFIELQHEKPNKLPKR